MPHLNPARSARIGIDHSRPGDDNALQFVQLADCLGIDRTCMGNRDGGPEQTRHLVSGFGEREFAPVVVEVWDGQVVCGEGGTIEENDADRKSVV